MRKYKSVDYVALGKKIAQRRQELNYSQKEIAEYIDCNESYLSRVENGKARPTFDFVVILARVLDVGIDYFLPYTPIGSKIILHELQDKWANCSPELAKFLDHILEEAKQLEVDIYNKNHLY